MKSIWVRIAIEDSVLKFQVIQPIEEHKPFERMPWGRKSRSTEQVLCFEEMEGKTEGFDLGNAIYPPKETEFEHSIRLHLCESVHIKQSMCTLIPWLTHLILILIQKTVILMT